MLKKKFDPRWVLLLNHTLLLSTGVLIYNLNRTALEIVLSLGTAVVVELVLAKICDKEVDRIGSRVLSALIAALGFLILTYSKAIWYYPLGSAVAIGSKYLFRYDKKHHIYNPTGFAIVFAFAVFPQYKPTFYLDTFLTATYPTLQVLVLGILATCLAKRWVLSLTYYIGMLIGAAILHLLGRHWFMYIIGPELGVMGLVIPFFMITDPRSSPDNYFQQVLWGLHYVFWNLLLKDQFVYASNFLASFITMSIAPVLRHELTRSQWATAYLAHLRTSIKKMPSLYFR